jgi:hypothetical protein
MVSHFASILDRLSDGTSLLFAAAAFGVLFLLLNGLDRV